MGGEQASKVMTIVAESIAEARGTEPDYDGLKKQEAFLIEHYNKQANGFFTSGNLMDDGMIDPRETRNTLGFLMTTAWEARRRETRPNSFGVARI